MRVTLLFFGVLKDVMKGEREAIDVPRGATVASVLRLLEERASNESAVWKTLAVAVNRQYVDRSWVLREDDEVALLPPVSGGLEGARS